SYWSGPVVITTLCNPVALPLTEPFSTWVPECFDIDNGDGNWTPYVSSGDTIAARARNTWGNYANHRLIQTPMIDMDQAALLTLLWSHDDSFSDTLKVNLSDDGGASWETIWSVTGADFESNDGALWSTPGSYATEYLLIDTSYIGEDVIVEIDYASPLNQTNDYIFIDSIAVTALPPCNVPYDLAVDSVNTTSVDMSFTVAGSGATLYEIEIIEDQNTITGVATNTASGTPFTVSGLNSGTDYTAYVRTMCGTDSTVWLGPITFTTVCAPVMDYYTSFEGLMTNDPVNCWNFIDSTSATNSFVRVLNSSWTVGNTGTNSLHFEAGNANLSTSLQFAVMPEFSSLDDQTHRLRFYARQLANDGNKLVVGTVSDPDDVGTFTPKDTIVPATVFTQYTFNFDDYSGGDDHIAIRSLPGSSWSDSYLDDFEWHEIPNCFPPTNVNVDSIGLTTVSVSLDSSGTFGTEWLLELVDVSGINPTILDTAYSTSFTVGGLEPSTIYEMTISTNCSDAISEGTSVIFQTDCAAYGDFQNGFEDLSGGQDTSLCWDYTVNHSSLAGTKPWIQIINTTWNLCEGTKAVRMYSGNEFTADILLVTPELIDITSGSHNLTFETTTRSTWAPPSPYEVGTMTDGNDPSTFTSLYSGVANGTCDSVTVPFLSYAGTDTRIAIKFNATTTFDNLYIDNVRWEEAPDCATPASFTIEDLTDIDVTLDWLNASLDTVWHLELVDVLDTLDVYDSIPTDTVFTHPYIIGGLAENTIYSVYLTNPCDTNYNPLQITFLSPWAKNIGVNAILSPETTGCNTGDSTQITIEIENFGGQAVTGFPIELSWDDSIYFNVGTYMDTLVPYQIDTITIDGFYDFSTSVDTMFYIQTVLAGDSVATNDMASSSFTNHGTMWIDVNLNTATSGHQVGFQIVDTLYGVMVGQGGDIDGSGNLSSNNSYGFEVCVYPNAGYVMNAYDEGGTGWQGGTYSITRCGGIVIANNDGDSPDNGLDSSNWNVWELESQEVFIVEECPDNDLAVLSIDSLETSCGLGIESGYVQIMNFGNLDVAPNGATAQYQFNNSGLWIDFWDFDSGLASQTDTLYQLPDIDMSLAGTYTIAIKVVFALDEDNTSNEFEFELNSLPTLTEDSTTFNTDNGHWYSSTQNGVNNSWEWGTPTTANIGNNNDGKVWATNLTGNASLNEFSYINSPCYDFSDYTAPPEISFDYVRPGTSHSFRLQRSFNGGISWYTWPTWGANPIPASNSNDWTHATILMGNAPGQSSCIFRWRYSSSTWQGASEGFGFDNWEVKEHVEY
ncbi:hypothetical protein A9Q93_02725, partial [Nonlabens dokdonensis]